ncbi:MAG TPA: hypothetical protein PKM36_10570 [Propionibacteriaceae bacterium]|nr:hypothetical protein [Propionibacteriaceae bacterium]
MAAVRVQLDPRSGTRPPIEFVKPGRARVTTSFTLTDEKLDEIRHQAESQGKALVWFSNDIRPPTVP